MTINKPIHIGKISGPQGGKKYLFLHKITTKEYQWFFEDGSDTGIGGPSIEYAIREAGKMRKSFFFSPVLCGFRYTLPERDEHGMNALFHQLLSSRTSFNGVYFDEEAGHNCFVQNPSEEALSFVAKFQSSD